MLKFCMIIFLVSLSNSFSQENKQNLVPITIYEKIELESKIKILEIENEELKKNSKKIEKEIVEIRQEQKKEIRQEFKSEDLGVAYNIDQIYKNANEYYESAFNHLKWIVSILGSLIVGCQYLFKKSEDKRFEKIEAQMINRLNNAETNIIDKAKKKSKKFFIKEEKKLKEEISEIKGSQDLELKELKEYNLNLEFRLDYIKVAAFIQNAYKRVEQLENILGQEKYEKLDKGDLLYLLKEEYDDNLCYSDEYKDKYLELYDQILQLEKSKKENEKKIKEILEKYIRIILSQEKFDLIRRVLKEEKPNLTEPQIESLSIILSVKYKEEAKIKEMLKTGVEKFKGINLEEEDISYIINILDDENDAEIIKELEDMKKGDRKDEYTDTEV